MKTMTVAEVQEQYPDEWVLIEITRDRKDPRRVRGQLLAHSPHRGDLNESHRRFSAERPHARFFQFYTGALVDESEDVAIIL